MTKKEMLKSIQNELRSVERSECLLSIDYIEKRNAIFMLRKLRGEIYYMNDFSKLKGKELMHNLLNNL